jgi:hypothetical protein
VARINRARGRLAADTCGKPLFYLVGANGACGLDHLRVRQIVGHSGYSSFTGRILSDRHEARIAPGRGGVRCGRAFLDKVREVIVLARGETYGG